MEPRLAAPAEITVRLASVNDARTLAEFAARTFRDTFGPDNRPEDMDEYVARAFGESVQRTELSDHRCDVLLMETASHHLAGYAQLLVAEPPTRIAPSSAMELQRFYVDRPFHGLGLAQRLMRESLGRAIDRSADLLWLGVWEHNARAIAFYRKLGFMDAGSQSFMLGTDRQTDRIMYRTTRNRA